MGIVGREGERGRLGERERAKREREKDRMRENKKTDRWMNVEFLNADLPVNMYCESLEKAQSHTHFSAFFFSVFLRLKSAVDQILQLPSADVVAKRLKMNKKT